MIDCKQKRGSVKSSKLKGRCASKKIRYRDRNEAVFALHRAQNMAVLAVEITGATKRAEKRVYKCADCSGFHLTSLEKWTDKKENPAL